MSRIQFDLNETNKRNINNIIKELRYGREENETNSRVDSRRNGSLVQRDTSSSGSIRGREGGKQNEGLDLYSIENLTPEQIEDMVEAGAELGYTLLDGVQTKDEWIAQMREAIAEPLKDATGYNDAEVDELLNDMWNYPYEIEGQSKPVSEWAAEKGINVNEIENGTGETNGEDTPTELPGSTTVGGSTEAGVEQGGNNEGNAGTGGETVSGTNTAGNNSGT